MTRIINALRSASAWIVLAVPFLIRGSGPLALGRLFAVALEQDREEDGRWKAHLGMTRSDFVSDGLAAYCVPCGGNGWKIRLWRRRPYHEEEPCGDCHGRGIIPLFPCGECSGTGRAGPAPAPAGEVELPPCPACNATGIAWRS